MEIVDVKLIIKCLGQMTEEQLADLSFAIWCEQQERGLEEDDT